MIPETYLLAAVGLLQLTNTVGQIVNSILYNKTKISKEILDSLKSELNEVKSELETKILMNKELRADYRQEKAQREMRDLQLVALKRDYFNDTGKEWHYVNSN